MAGYMWKSGPIDVQLTCAELQIVPPKKKLALTMFDELEFKRTMVTLGSFEMHFNVVYKGRNPFGSLCFGWDGESVFSENQWLFVAR